MGSIILPEKKKQEIQNKILRFYEQKGRDLPWRKTKDPYKILVSEMMLQQTQVDRVINYYQRWLKTFPTFFELAKADKAVLLEHWQGLGYNNRALRLQKLAQQVVMSYNGHLPDKEEQLLELPGIGPYTAHAVMAFAFNKEVPVMDTNIRRVLIHELNLAEDITIARLQTIALELVPKGKSCIWHNALMDYGAMEKTARATGIKPLSKQSKFAGSTRETRGKILKYLLSAKKEKIAVLREKFPHEKFDQIIKGMQRDDIVKEKKRMVNS